MWCTGSVTPDVVAGSHEAAMFNLDDGCAALNEYEIDYFACGHDTDGTRVAVDASLFSTMSSGLTKSTLEANGNGMNSEGGCPRARRDAVIQATDVGHETCGEIVGALVDVDSDAESKAVADDFVTCVDRQYDGTQVSVKRASRRFDSERA